MPRPDVDCCTPIQAPTPSGWRWVHSRWCKVAPRQRVVAGRRTAQDARKDHPAGTNLPTRDPAYMDAHSDDDDDSDRRGSHGEHV